MNLDRLSFWQTCCQWHQHFSREKSVRKYLIQDNLYSTGERALSTNVINLREILSQSTKLDLIQLVQVFFAFYRCADSTEILLISCIYFLKFCWNQSRLLPPVNSINAHFHLTKTPFIFSVQQSRQTVTYTFTKTMKLLNNDDECNSAYLALVFLLAQGHMVWSTFSSLSII